VKVWRSLAARRDVRARYAAWAAAARDPARPLLWLHAPSVGEGLQARPVAQLVRQRRPDLQLVYTYFSPSAERFAATVGADFTDYLPFDTAGDARAVLDALRPTALVFNKLDVWPVLAGAAASRGVALGLLSATLAPGSGRRGWPAASLLRPAYAALDGWARSARGMPTASSRSASAPRPCTSPVTCATTRSGARHRRPA
jgi:3-deoxy-D-manno-octulosonic-acid transferase